MRAGFRSLLNRAPDIEVVAEARDGLEAARRVIEHFPRPPEPSRPGDRLSVLTEREREVMAAMGAGLGNQEIAERLHMSPLTAKTRATRVIGKLGARDRAQVVVLAHETGLVRPGRSDPPVPDR
ncbi:response regulator transcription factor [Actinomadura madurae]|uniref:response regulator transcription factor n=2 Tax=Actinomadura madurae TaxID=1993 RepID=UPI0020D1F73C|nr:LuxR C-terminal-related transcriptional regulator [Actinomadura madurae]MCP9951359.1 LuxR C-terminal-related transcriptional regulator [Actinomadura madurae]MCP9968133.1 LuxR C-terminal-related transcriptional regulator [Actinomadura madurae]MCP9980592.1 LuxR C-terminal-related transcriptional regulator [Actinomadura madurae]MCQ0007894.1 LuxR C-terminal-related transcriptional regulator [Actinomadura madurae]MCQ0016794.1 LuxR C-terminal-related transcriptional regulator [Actinomadura madura